MEKKVYNKLKERVEYRIKPILPLLRSLRVYEFRIAGNSLNIGKPNDLDLYPVKGFSRIEQSEDFEIIFRTKNATTIKYNDILVQFCNYKHDSLKNLIDSFDFSHIQVGAEVIITDSLIESIKVYYTKDYYEARLLGISEFTGSEYPLSSLFRLNKYFSRKEMDKHQMFSNSFSILSAIIKRGFYSYQDFKDQLDAVDLGLLPEDFSETDGSDLMTLFELLRKDGK